MQNTQALGRAALIRYRDPKGAIDWLCAAFQFEKRFTGTRSDGSFAYAHLELGGQQVTVTARDESSLEPAEPSARSADARSLAVPDIAGHLARAKAEGAEIVHELAAGTYTCRDVEGQLWCFRESRAPMLERMSARLPRVEKRAGLAAAAALTLVALAVSAWQLVSERAAAPALGVGEGQALENARFALAEEQAARQMAEASRKEALAALARERSARLEAERDAQRVAAELDAARAAQTTAATRAQDLDEQLTAWQTQVAPTLQSPSAPVSAPAPAAEVVPVAAREAAPKASQTSVRASDPRLADGQAALAKGDVAEARRLFRRLAEEEGMPAAALALGSTYDPVNVSQTGLTPEAVDAAKAKHWYRRAIELTREREPSERQIAP